MEPTNYSQTNQANLTWHESSWLHYWVIMYQSNGSFSWMIDHNVYDRTISTSWVKRWTFNLSLCYSWDTYRWDLSSFKFVLSMYSLDYDQMSYRLHDLLIMIKCFVDFCATITDSLTDISYFQFCAKVLKFCLTIRCMAVWWNKSVPFSNKFFCKPVSIFKKSAVPPNSRKLCPKLFTDVGFGTTVWCVSSVSLFFWIGVGWSYFCRMTELWNVRC